MFHVEQSFFSTLMQLSFRLVLLLVFFVLGCEKPLENPESVDPIYKDYLAEAANAKKAAEEEKKALETLIEEVSELKPRDPSAKKVIAKRFAQEKKILKLEERAKYYELRAESRKRYDQEAYRKAYKAKQPWPDPAEIEQYKTVRRLHDAPRNWDARVPKLKDPKTTSEPVKEAAPPAH